MSLLRNYSLKDIEYWNERIEKEIIPFLGLEIFPQEFEIVSQRAMLERTVYFGMKDFYPNWAAGKRYDIKDTLVGLGLEYLPYELVRCSNPCLAYLMTDNDLAMQILTMAHVYGHNNFFKNNGHFKKYAKADSVVDFLKSSEERIRSYSSDISIGKVNVRKCIEAAHALMYQSSELLGTNPGEVFQRQDLLLFLSENSPRQLQDWEKDIINIVRQMFNCLFRPAILTTGVNEGWATYCHYKITRALKLPAELYFAFARHHSSVVRLPDQPTAYNKYLVNFVIWNEIENAYYPDNEDPTAQIRPIPPDMFRIMSSSDDESFLSGYLTKDIAKKLRLFLWEIAQNKDITVGRIIEGADNEKQENKSFNKIKERLLKGVGFNSMPVINVAEPNYEGNRSLYLRHEFDERFLEPEHTLKTLQYVYYFWGKMVLLETKTYNRKVPYIYQFDGKIGSQFRKR